MFELISDSALPILSDPGSLAIVIGFTSQTTGPTDYFIHALSILLVVLISYVLLRLAPISKKYISYTGLNVMTRLMSFIVQAISVQFILSGISQSFNLNI